MEVTIVLKPRKRYSGLTIEEFTLAEDSKEITEDTIRERMAPESLVKSSEKSRELAGAYLSVLRQEVPADHHFGSAGSIHALKDALVAIAEQASESHIAISDDELARVIEYTAYLDELDHPQVLVDDISLLIRAIHSLKPDLQHSSDWVGSEDKEIQASSERRWFGENS